MAKLSEPLPTCPVCDADDTTVTEDVSDEVTVLRCGSCQRTWALRAD